MRYILAGDPPEGLAFDLSSLIGGGDSTASAAIGAVASVIGSNQTFLTNRARLAAVTQMGYNAMAAYEEWQPALFLASVGGAVAGGYMLYQRRQKGSESIALWTITTLAALGVAYFTRPSFLRAVPTVDPTATPAMAGVLSYLDQKVADYTAATPGWEGPILETVAADAGGGTIDPALATLLTENSH